MKQEVCVTCFCGYWIGWAVAYYQWYFGRKYSDILQVLPFADLQKMYETLHEADITKFADFVDIADQRIGRASPISI